jgi:DNA-binding NtrC family response regulator/tetratricopeptide (TPR) repeat protein/class 3 adenylate cyclase
MVLPTVNILTVEREAVMARSDPVSHAHPTDRIVGNAPAIQALRAQIRHLATFDTVGSAFVPTLLLHGETGTGKGLVARVIHDSGPRAQGPFVEVNCAAIPETLLEAELFGFEAGTFTDARRAKPGLMESAAHGTLFLDEIDALQVLLQAKLLSAIEEKRVRRLGAVGGRQLDVKFIAATSTDLSVRVAEGQFRSDLYHRLAVVLLEIPPLRERGEDILALAQHFVRQYAEAHELPPKQVSRDAEAWLQGYGWPGNVRELSHLMERVTLFSPGAVVTAATLEQLCLPRPLRAVPAAASPARGGAEPLDAPARIQRALGQTGGNVVQAARLLGISRGALRYWMRRHGIGRPRWQTLIPPHRSQAQEVIGPSEVDSGRSTSVELRALASAWEQKFVVVLALDVTWPEVMEQYALRTEPWTLATRWHQIIAEKIHGLGGRIVQSTPSPVTAVFGLPQTLEQMPQRAVQAALAIRHQLAEDWTSDSRPPGPEVRMAIHLGQVLVDVQASDPIAQLLPLGETLSLPVRLLGHAAPGDILLSPQVGHLVEGWFELYGREGPAGAGLADGVGAYAVVGVGPRCSPLEVYGKRPLSRFVGRERELTTLHEILAQVAQGRGQIVGLVGEPGVGKSRLCYELTQARRPYNWLILESSPVAYGKDTPYLPVLDLLKAYFELDARDEPQTIRAKVLCTLGTLEAGLEPILPAVLALLDVPVDDSSWQALEPRQRRQRTLEACTRLLLRASQVQPLLLVVENLHWIDTETQVFLDRLVDSLPSARIVLLVNYRPEYQQRWGSKTYYTQLRLDPLPPVRAEELLRGLLGEHPALEPLIQLLIARTEGNPFFLEESVRTLVDTGVLVGERRAYQLAQAPLTMQVPTTVQAVLAVRIDRLPPAEKRLLQTAAVIGLEVSVPLLQAIAELPAAATHDSLRYLQVAEFLYETHLIPEQVYTFKHALTHEVAYGCLPQERRRVLHARIVEVMEALYPDRLAEQVERLAYHALRGEVWEKALAYYQQAGDKAMARSAFREAVACFEQALTALRHLPEQRHTQEQVIDLCDDLSNALQALGEFGRRFSYLREAETLAEVLGDQRRLGWICTRMTHAFWTTGDYDNALTCGQRALTLAAATRDAVQQARVNGFLGTVYFYLGDYRRAIDVFKQAIPSYEDEWRHERFGEMMIASARDRLWLLQCCAEVGAFAEGLAYGEEAARIAETAGHLTGMVMTQDRLGVLAFRKGDLQHAIFMLEHALVQCRAADIPLYLYGIMANLGLAYAWSGQVTEALPLLDEVVVHEKAGRAGRGGSDMMLSLGEAYLLAGRLADALQLAERALVLSRDRKERGNQAWALRLLGAIALHHRPPEVVLAEAHYRQALALADELGMRPLVAHCHAGLGTLYTTASRWEQAHTELATAIALYRVMAMTFWLQQTEATLAQVPQATGNLGLSY